MGELVIILNDPRVYKFLLTPPYPYRPHHAEEWLRATKDKSDGLLEALREGESVVDGCSIQYIRETQHDGTDLLLGDISVVRNGWIEVSDEEQRARLAKENLGKPVGDHSIVWTMGGALQSAVKHVPLKFRRLS